MQIFLRLLKDKEGNAAIEFAMLAPVFFTVVLGLLEFGIFQYRVHAFNELAYEMTRDLMTGEIYQAGNNETERKAKLLANAASMAMPLIDSAEVTWDVRTYNTLADVQFPALTYNPDGTPQVLFATGGPNTYSVVRAMMPHTFVTPFMSKIFAGDVNKDMVVSGYYILKNEPWS